MNGTKEEDGAAWNGGMGGKTVIVTGLQSAVRGPGFWPDWVGFVLA